MTSGGRNLPESDRIGDLAAAHALFAPIACEPNEVAAFAYLDPEWRLLGIRHARSASPCSIELPMRAVTADALIFDAAGVIMAHNHPSGDTTPSEADRAVTTRLGRILDALGIRLLDHLVLSGERMTSFRALGLL